MENQSFQEASMELVRLRTLRTEMEIFTMTENIKKNVDRLGLDKPEPKPLVKTTIGVTSATSAILLGLAAPSLLDSSTL